MLEKEVERKLVKSVKNEKGICIKLISSGMVGLPDRLVLMPKGKIAFIELKAPRKKPRPIQFKRMNQIKKLGFKVYVLDNVEMIGGMIDEIQSS